MARKVKNSPQTTSKDLQHHLAADGVTVHRSNIRCTLHKEKLYGRVMQKKPFLHTPLTESLEKDGDLDVFLRGFEKVRRQFHLPKEQWGRYLTPRLRGKALDVFALLPSESDQDYEAIKSALLISFNLTPEAYRKRFRTLQQSATESCTEHAGQLRTAFRQWTGGLQVTTYEALEDLMVLDQFLQTRSFEAREWILDRKPKTAMEAVELGDDFANNRVPAAKRGSAQAGASTWRGATQPQSTTRPARKFLPSSPKATGATLGPGDTRRCYRCNNIGHLSATCPNTKNSPPVAGGHTAVLLVSGAVEKRADNLQSVTVGDRVTVGLRDSGASFTLVRPEVVDTEDIIPGRTMALKGIGGVRPAMPMACVYLDWGTGKGLREVGVSKDIPVNVLLWNDLGR
ncbi:uncharacterized protein LOC130357457, partial [Hyla sarda]|uniref:uncharacterized protein LOC130357457 n=1 Tax=Hyla sarda TaxID=327740 RepID=UPI0024C3FF26